MTCCGAHPAPFPETRRLYHVAGCDTAARGTRRHDRQALPVFSPAPSVRPPDARRSQRCSAMKASHLKSQADEAMRSGNYGVAAEKCASIAMLRPASGACVLTRACPPLRCTLHRYSQCITLSPAGERDAKLLCNRALAHLKAGRPAQAAEDAERACKLAPEWSKAWFRQGAARAALGDHPGALAAHRTGLRLDQSNRELRAAVRAAVRRLTREQLAAELLHALAETQAAGGMLPPEAEDVTPAEREEAMFRHLQLYMRDKPAPGDYYDYVTLWSEAPWSPGAPQPVRLRIAVGVH